MRSANRRGDIECLSRIVFQSFFWPQTVQSRKTFTGTTKTEYFIEEERTRRKLHQRYYYARFMIPRMASNICKRLLDQVSKSNSKMISIKHLRLKAFMPQANRRQCLVHLATSLWSIPATAFTGGYRNIYGRVLGIFGVFFKGQFRLNNGQKLQIK